MSAAIVLRGLQIGDIGGVAHRQGISHAQAYGRDGTFETLLAKIAARFVKNLDSGKENARIAECAAQLVGSVSLVKVSDQVGHLRLLDVAPHARGVRLGQGLTGECIALASARGYQRIALWIHDIWVAARRIDQAAGFDLQAPDKHHAFGHELVGAHGQLLLPGQETNDVPHSIQQPETCE